MITLMSDLIGSSDFQEEFTYFRKNITDLKVFIFNAL